MNTTLTLILTLILPTFTLITIAAGHSYMKEVRAHAERLRQSVPAEPGHLLQARHRRASVGCAQHRPNEVVRHLRGWHGLRRTQVDHRDTHRMLPASSKIGKYIRTTMPPITSPIIAIMAGSMRRVATSTKRDSSSS